MSDEEYEMEWPSEEGDDACANDDQSDGDVEIQNNFYEAEGLLKEDPKRALEMFETVVLLEENKDEVQFSFNAIKYIIILSAQLHEFNKMVQNTRSLLKLAPKVSKNDVSEATNAILDSVSNHLGSNPEQQREMYQIILEKLKLTNERLWFNMSLRLGKIYLDEASYSQLSTVIDELKDTCREEGNPANFDISKGNILLEVFALEIQMCIATKQQRRMHEVYQLTTNFSSVIEDPRVVGIIKECGGKMFMSEKKWEMALNAFFESFKANVDCGGSKATTVLKYVIMTSMLCNSEVDWMGTKEAKIFKDDPQIIAMVSLKEGFETNNIQQIQDVLADKKINLLSDPFIAQYLDDLLRSVRLKALESICKPYVKVKLDFLAQELNVDINEIRSLLSELILEEKIKGQIDQLNGFLELSAAEQKSSQKHRAMEVWGRTLLEMHQQLTKKINNNHVDINGQNRQGIYENMLGGGRFAY